MELRFLDRGTLLDIEFLTRDLKPFSDEKFAGNFYDIEKDLTFFITSDELFEKLDEFDPSCYLKITFRRGLKAYTFTGKFSSIVKKSRENLILITAASPLKKIELRNAPRIDISLPVNIYKIAPDAPNQAGELLLKGYSKDISNTGICIFSDTLIQEQHDSEFIAEFSIIRDNVFSLRAKLMRSGNSPIISYKYAYGFLFIYDDNSDEKSNLTVSMFKYKTNSQPLRPGR